ncbi:hypothetical protein IAT38_003973 [Cryptococcus sp. DSM 104549]
MVSSPQPKSLPPVAVQFLGTSSGGGPILSRNCSSLAVDFGNEIWLFDAADGTLSRLHQSSLRIANITRIFITHLHADHVLGLVPVLTTVMSGIGAKPGANERLKSLGVNKKPTFHMYGPAGLRKLVRTSLQLTEANLEGVYAVHELLEEGQTPSVGCAGEELHTNEGVGMDLRTDEDGVWKAVLAEGKGSGGKGWGVSAGPLHHRVPSLGYILQEPTPLHPIDTATLIPLLRSNAEALAAQDPPVKHPLSLLSLLTALPPPPPITLPSGDIIHPPGPSGTSPRKIVIFGDCSGGTRNSVFKEMCKDASLLVHECTNGAIPGRIQKGPKGQAVRAKDLAPSLVSERGVDVGGSGSAHSGKEGNGHTEKSGQPKSKASGQTEEKEFEEKKVQVRQRAQGRGHSTPDEVGEFAREIRARRVVINHFSAMFPSPRYSASDPLPSILSPLSPFPYPTPHPIPQPKDIPIHPIPLTNATRGELHTRLIMQSLADQIWDICGEPIHPPNGPAPSQQTGSTGLVVPARDFMHIRIPAHDLTAGEKEDVKRYKTAADAVAAEWGQHDGIWLRSKTGERRWIGTGPEVTSTTGHAFDEPPDDYRSFKGV